MATRSSITHQIQERFQITLTVVTTEGTFFNLFFSYLLLTFSPSVIQTVAGCSWLLQMLQQILGHSLLSLKWISIVAIKLYFTMVWSFCLSYFVLLFIFTFIKGLSPSDANLTSFIGGDPNNHVIDVISTGPNMLVHFTSDDALSGLGFSANWAITQYLLLQII